MLTGVLVFFSSEFFPHIAMSCWGFSDRSRTPIVHKSNINLLILSAPWQDLSDKRISRHNRVQLEEGLLLILERHSKGLSKIMNQERANLYNR